MMEALAKGDEVITAGGIAGPCRASERRLCHPRSRRRYRDGRAEERHHHAAAEGHAEVAVSTATAATSCSGRRRSARTLEHYESLSRLEIHTDRCRAPAGRAVHGAQLTSANRRPLQITTGKTTVKITSDDHGAGRETRCKREGVPANQVTLEGAGNSTAVRARFATPTPSSRPSSRSSASSTAMRPTPTTSSPSTWSNTPAWMQALRAQADEPRPRPARRRPLPAASRSRGRARTKMKGTQASVRSILRDKNVRHAGIERGGNTVEVTLPRRGHPQRRARPRSAAQSQDLVLADAADGTDLKSAGHPEAGSAQAHRGRRRQPEHHHPVASASTNSA